jgi:hypothetical protein
MTIASNTWRDLPCGCSRSERWIVLDLRCGRHALLISDRDRADAIRARSGRGAAWAYGPVPFGGVVPSTRPA